METHKKRTEAATAARRNKPTVDLEQFTYKNENFERLFYNPERSLAVFRRTNALSDKLIAYEVVVGKGAKKHYPSDEDFGTYGWCYTGTDDQCKKAIKNMHGIVI